MRWFRRKRRQPPQVIINFKSEVDAAEVGRQIAKASEALNRRMGR